MTCSDWISILCFSLLDTLVGLAVAILILKERG
jgi:hypothetical protein